MNPSPGCATALAAWLPGTRAERMATLRRYVMLRFLGAYALVYGICAVMVFLIDLVEFLRRADRHDDLGLLPIIQMALYRVPSFTEQALPFIILLGSIAAFLSLSRRNELVVVRSAGMSVWQFTMPAALLAVAIGALVVTAFNPLSAYLLEEEAKLEVEYLGRNESVLGRNSTGAWLRQEGVDGQSVIYATSAREKGLVLDDVSVFVFDANGVFVERIEAKSAVLRTDYWELLNAVVVSPASQPQQFASYQLSTYLSQAQIQESFSRPETVSFWDLPGFIELAERAGLPATAYHVQYQLLMSLPLLLCTMVVIAATVSLRQFRFGGIGRMVLFGLAAGFLFYVVSELFRDLGSSGIIAPAVAAWVPAIIVMLAGLTVLLYQEDG